MPSRQPTPQLFAGLMSGTSMDGIDAALVSFADHECTVVATHSHPYPQDLVDALLDASRNPLSCTVDTIGSLDHRVGACFRDAAIEIIEKQKLKSGDIAAIGSHGQTLRHQPRAAAPFSLQIGDPNIIAAGTGITTVADFRRRDIALGGEGAPLAPAFHHWLFSTENRKRAVLNIGGFANITLLDPDPSRVIGFDTGPGNTLLDAWCRRDRNLPFDDGGEWARSGNIDDALLAKMLDDPYFSLPAPKSTGFEYFGDSWLLAKIETCDPAPSGADVQATLAELTARSIADAALSLAPEIDELLVCGGGVHNRDLMERLKRQLGAADVKPTSEYGLHPDSVEAAAFAWLAMRCLEKKPGNLPSVTGAREPAILGAIYP